MSFLSAPNPTATRTWAKAPEPVHEGTPEQRFELITRHLAEVLNGDTIQAILSEGKRNPKCYWGESSPLFVPNLN
jgi:hypothetical protein